MLLTLLIFTPLLGVLLIALLPKENIKALRLATLAVTSVVTLLGLVLWSSFDGSIAGFQPDLDVAKTWFYLPLSTVQVPIQFRLGIDGLSILMVALTAVLMPLVVLSSYGHVNTRVKEFLIWLLVMEAGMMGVFLSLDLVLFYVFWEISLVPLYFILGIWGGEDRIYATVKFFLFTVAGSLVMLVAILALILQTSTASLPELLEAGTYAANGTPPTWIFLAFALAFSIKVPLLPFHTWLADAHTQAPTSGSVLLAGVLLKMGTYGLLRFGIQLFPEAVITWSPLFMGLGAVGIVYGAFLAMAQNDLKRLVACSSISHLGFVVLGMFALTQAGLRGSVLQMVSHGISTGLLFLLVGMIYERRHTRALDQFGGLASTMPVFALFFVFAVLSSVGLPGLNGFVGEFLILMGSFEASKLWGTVGVTGIVFGAIYLLTMTRRVLFGPVIHEANRKLADLTPREILTMTPLCVLVVWIGVQPNYFLGKSDASIDLLHQRLEMARGSMESARLERNGDEPLELVFATQASPLPLGGLDR
ncbi:MAG: NADH-quinone oxidoreductase subunit M [Planctomycetota bacterium]|jgi:NADH-quinone oxidoreductase subunit M